ncbi:MAG: hypothetical protein R3C68_01445 [Myxococcota bacterium]
MIFVVVLAAPLIILAGMSAVIAGCGLKVSVLKDYQKRRILTFINPVTI